MSEKTWYLLFGGSSPDGRGTGKFIGRTTDKQKAKKYYEKIEDDPYSTGYVMIVTDAIYDFVSWVSPELWDL